MTHSDVFSVVILNSELLFFNPISGNYLDSIHREQFVPKGNDALDVKFEVKRAGKILDEGNLQCVYLDYPYFIANKIFSDLWKVTVDTKNCSHCFLPTMFKVDDEIVFHHNSARSISDQIDQSASSLTNSGRACDELDFSNLNVEVFKKKSKYIYRFRKGI